MNPKIENAVHQTAGFLQDVDFFFFKGCRLSFVCIVSCFLNIDQVKNRFTKCESGRWECESFTQ